MWYLTVTNNVWRRRLTAIIRKHDNKMEFYSINTVWLQEAAGLSEGWVCFCELPKWPVWELFSWLIISRRKWHLHVHQWQKAQLNCKDRFFKNSHKWFKEKSLILLRIKTQPTWSPRRSPHGICRNMRGTSEALHGSFASSVSCFFAIATYC